MSASRGRSERAAADRIGRLDIARCALPLERPVRVGRTTYREREYVALRIITLDGVEGHAIGYTRGLPLDAMVRMLVDAIVGRRAKDPAGVVDDARRSHVNAAASMGRAFSLLDIALADAVARRAGEPLWRLLGGARTRVPIMAVAGYHGRERGSEAVVAEVGTLVDRGIRHIKLHTADIAVISAVLETLDDSVRVGIDTGMAWRSLAEAEEAIRALDGLGLDFIEDPFPPERWRLTAELAARTHTTLAAGEDASGPELLADIAGSVGILRVDATVSGGITAVLDVAGDAARRGVEVMTHAFPDQHAHLAGHPAVGLVEMIPDETDLNPVGRLLARRQVVESGELRLSGEPGHGAPLDWSAVEAVAREVTVHTLPVEERKVAPCN